MTLAEEFMAWRKDRVSIEHIEHHPILDHETTALTISKIGGDSRAWFRQVMSLDI